MRVGIFLSGYHPVSGGGFTFEQEMLGALRQLVAESHHHFTLFFSDDSRTLAPLPANYSNMRIVFLEKQNLITKVTSFALTIIKNLLGNKKTVFLNPLQKAIAKEGIELLWFPTPIYLPVDIPYIATMWDIQHRIQPWFPEVSQNGIWDYREDYFANFLRRATFIITPNQTGQDELVMFYQIPPKRFRCLPHPTPQIERIPTPNEVAAVRSKYNLSKQYLFYPAQFWAHKNHVNLLKALSILQETYGLNLDLALTGFDQGNLKYIQTVVEELHLKERVHFLGFIPREDLISLYSGAFALTYVTYFGPENLPPLEAFACGCPVIASDVAGAAEQFGEAALQVNASRPEEIALAVKKIYDNPQLHADLIEKGLERSKKFNNSDYIRGVFEIIDEFESVRVNWR